MVADVEHPRAGKQQLVASAVHMSRTPPRRPTAAPLLGQHGREVLREAGVDDGEVARLLATGVIAGGLFVFMFTVTQNRWKIDDVLGVWPLHGLCGAWGGIAAGIFGLKAFGGLGGVSLSSQMIGSLLGIAVAVAGGLIVYGALKALVGIRLDAEQEFMGADLSIHKISSTAEKEASW